MRPLNLMVYRHSAFYSPILAGIAGGFFAREGFTPSYTVMPPGRDVGAMLASGEIQVSQASVSTSWSWLDRGTPPPFTIFATLNRRDGFCIAARRPDPDFRWKKLLKGGFVYAHGGQPQAMLAYALHLKGIDLAHTRGLDRGGPAESMAAFAAGEGDWFHEQAPYPQQLEAEGKAAVVASTGEVIGPVAFSALAATPAWLARPEAAGFVEAFRAAREWTHRAPAAEVAETVRDYFPKIGSGALACSIGFYQKLGCWDGPLGISRPEYETTLDVFGHSGLIAHRHAYEQVVSPLPQS
jgi:NitT/TauT family transport system substrate-binding protein